MLTPIYVVAKTVYDHEGIPYTEMIRAFRVKEEAEAYKDVLKPELPWQLEVTKVDLEDYSS
jgi:hypothetical protein